VVQGQSGGGLGDEVPRSWRVWGGEGVSPPHWGVWERSGEGAVPSSQIFFNFYLKMVSFGAFWVHSLYVIYLIIYWILKETVVTFRLMCERTTGCVCPSYLNNSSAAHSNSSSWTQKKVFRLWVGPCSIKSRELNFIFFFPVILCCSAIPF